jgi:2-polyprenyl-3-methyl-5-hydroxy-6-metoxy-1,4-benzoquinol methylase
MSANCPANLPKTLFLRACREGLSCIRPLTAEGRKRDQFGWNFGATCPPSYPAFGRMRALLAVTEAEALAPKRVLEVAAGDGSLVATIEARTGCEVWANDLREENLRAGLSSYSNASKVRIAPGNIFELSPSLGTFDLVIACEVIEHVAHGVDFLRKLADLTTPGGHILVTTPSGSHFRNRLPSYYEIEDHTALEKNQFKPDADGHLFLIRPDEMYRLAKEAGLQVERLALWGSPFLTGHFGLRLLGNVLPASACVGLEAMVNASPLRETMCFAMNALLRRP